MYKFDLLIINIVNLTVAISSNLLTELTAMYQLNTLNNLTPWPILHAWYTGTKLKRMRHKYSTKMFMFWNPKKLIIKLKLCSDRICTNRFFCYFHDKICIIDERFMSQKSIHAVKRIIIWIVIDKHKKVFALPTLSSTKSQKWNIESGHSYDPFRSALG